MFSRQRFVVVGILALAIIAAIPLSHLLQWTFVQVGWDDPPMLSRELPMTRVIAYGVAAAAAVFCLKHRTTYNLALEVADEMSKVTWPSREETGYATVVVLVTVLICSVYLGVFDAVWLWLTDMILGVEAAPTAT
ncbi:MAG: preprotein translocase subunit SecE [Deltaproteobacteria bacterium]|nr:preprotein translocase subunit SecE [Deltaproteobacteria bacterium]